MSIVQKTEDGSPTLFSNVFGESYHSLYGAVDESNTVFIYPGLLAIAQQTPHISIFEMGFGSGLNAWLSYVQSQLLNLNIFYHSIEKFPVNTDAITEFYTALCAFCPEKWKPFLPVFIDIHACEWNKVFKINDNFTILKNDADISRIALAKEKYNLVYYDAFSPNVQPELWETAIFEKIYGATQQEAILMTYCCKGNVRRAMKSAGFGVTKLPGPKGKREITKAVKNVGHEV